MLQILFYTTKAKGETARGKAKGLDTDIILFYLFLLIPKVNFFPDLVALWLARNW